MTMLYTESFHNIKVSNKCLDDRIFTHDEAVTIIIIMAGMTVFYVAGYLIEERRRWPVITASPRGQCSK